MSEAPIFCKKLSSSFMYAFRGIKFAIIGHRNIKIHIIAGILAFALGLYLNLSRLEFLILIPSIFLVLITETINTAIEKNIDLYTKDIDRNAMLGKDMAAGAVLLSSINACIVGIILFIPKISALIQLYGGQ